MQSLTSALRRIAPALAITAAMFTTFAPQPAAAASYSGFYADYSAQELMRLTNKDRVALGRHRLKVDTYLVGLARDMQFTCPTTGKVYSGRAKDMASRDYLSHAIAGCKRSDGSAYTIQHILKRAGYSTYTGENIGQNNWPDTAGVYKVGCSISGGSCKGTTTSTAPVATVEKMWMRSSGHRTNILNRYYDRFGCGAWDNADGTKYFVCIFAKGGPKPTDGTAPAVASTDDNVAELRQNDDITVQATFSDGFRLSDGWVKLDGVMKRGWSYNLNTKSVTETLTIDPATLAAGTHSVTWAIRDVAGHVTRKTVSFTVTK